MNEKIQKIYQLERQIYDAGNRWFFSPIPTRNLIEVQTIPLANERKALLKELTDKDRELYYPPFWAY